MSSESSTKGVLVLIVKAICHRLLVSRVDPPVNRFLFSHNQAMALFDTFGPSAALQCIHAILLYDNYPDIDCPEVDIERVLFECAMDAHQHFFHSILSASESSSLDHQVWLHLPRP
jgi:hypothetical protein